MKGVTCVCACAVLTLVLGSLSAPTPALAQFGGDREAETDSPFAPSEHKAKPAAAIPTCLCVGQGDQAQLKRIKQALRSPLQGSGLQFQEVPLEQVVASLKDQYDIEVQIEVPALDDIGLSVEDPVTVDLRNISLQSALRLMLGTLHLTYVIRDEVLVITTPEEAESRLSLCIYDVRDLVGSGGSDALVDTIVACVATDTWAENGGKVADIRLLPRGLLVIAQTQSNHDEIRQLLHALSKLGHRADAHQLAGGDAFLADPDPVVTRNYQLLPVAKEDRQALPRQVTNLIVQMLPDERWKGKLDNGETVVLVVLPNRVIVRQRQSVQNKVRTLLKESGLIASGQHAFGGVGGGGIATESSGGGFFRVEPEGANEPKALSEPVEENPFGF
jgi:hypothetical protein